MSAEDLVREKQGEYRFSLADVVAGSYVVEVTPSRYHQLISVAEGAEDVRIEVPSPAEVVARVLDGETRRPRNGVRLAWLPKLPTGSRGCWSMESVESESSELRFRAPVAKISVHGTGDDWEIQQDLEIHSGRNEIELVTERMYGVNVELYEGGTRIPSVPFLTDWRVSLEKRNGEQRDGEKRDGEQRDGEQRDGASHESRASGWSHGARYVTKPGRYILHIAAARGYQPVPDREVAVEARPFPTLRIEVARAR